MKKRNIILELDGVPFELIDNLSNTEIMPNFNYLKKENGFPNMRSSIPHVSSVSWSSIITGENPGEHGIFGFMEIDRNNYEYIFPNFKSIKSDLFWERLDLPTVAFNIPQTYPARPINGVIVRGFVALDLKQAVYPERIYEYLKSIEDIKEDWRKYVKLLNNDSEGEDCSSEWKIFKEKFGDLKRINPFDEDYIKLLADLRNDLLKKHLVTNGK